MLSLPVPIKISGATILPKYIASASTFSRTNLSQENSDSKHVKLEQNLKDDIDNLIRISLEDGMNWICFLQNS